MTSEQNITAITEESPISDPHTFDSFGRALIDAVIRAANNKLEAKEVDPSVEVIEFDVKVQVKRDSAAGEKRRDGFCCVCIWVDNIGWPPSVFCKGSCC